MSAMRMAERPASSTVVDTCRLCGLPIILDGSVWLRRDLSVIGPCDRRRTPHVPSTGIAPGMIIPQSPAMRLTLNAMDVAEDTLREDARGDCSDCDGALDGKCAQHQAALHEAEQIKALRDKLATARGIDEVAALLAGVEVAA